MRIRAYRHCHLLLLLALVLLRPEALGADSRGVAPERQVLLAYQYLNQQRLRAGLPALDIDGRLERAARAHAGYLGEHRTLSHHQRPERRWFTGEGPGQRALAAGYGSSDVSENVSRGQRNAIAAIDDLLSGIYHRYGFLDPEMTDIGIGIAQAEARAPVTYVFLLGNGLAASLCQGESFTGPGYYLDDVCADDRRVAREDWDAVKLEVQRRAPELIIWPGRDAADVPPAFYDEIPDPLPEVEVSGYPVSVEFNRAYFGDVGLRRFVLRAEGGGEVLSAVALLSERSDPNGRLNGHQFALFPRERLQWGTRYRVELGYHHEGVEASLEWAFTTRPLAYPMIELGPAGAEYPIQAGATTAFLWQPTERRPFLRKAHSRFPGRMSVGLGWLDENTLLVTANGGPGDRAAVTFQSGYHFDVVIAETAPTPPAPAGALPPLPDLAPAPATAASPPPSPELPGKVIEGRAERFKVESGRKYLFSVRPNAEFPALGRLRYRYTPGMRVAVEREGEHSVAVQAFGRAGNQAIFTLSGGRSFSVVIGR